MNKPSTKKHKKFVYLWIVLLVLIGVFLLFPRAHYVKDGGSVIDEINQLSFSIVNKGGKHATK